MILIVMVPCVLEVGIMISSTFSDRLQLKKSKIDSSNSIGSKERETTQPIEEAKEPNDMEK
jgi:hypothetical protein